MENTPQFIPPRDLGESDVKEAEKCFSQYENLRQNFIDLSNNVGRRTLGQDVDSKEMFRAIIKDGGIVMVEFVDIYQWFSNGSIAYMILLNPADKNYLSGDPQIRVSSESLKKGEGVQHAVPTSMITLSPGINAGLERTYYLDNEQKMVDAIDFIYRIMDKKYSTPEPAI